MSSIRILPTDDLRPIAFKVCTALSVVGTTAVLTGGSAATIYAPEVYQSRDADFIALFVKSASDFREAISQLGFVAHGRVYAHPDVPITIEFPDQEIRIGSEAVDRYLTLREAELALHILTPTDCIRDRLASFFWYHDRSALAAALGVARARATEVSLIEIREWAAREGESQKAQEFFDRLNAEP